MFTMLEYTLAALFLTLLLGYIFETFKMFVTILKIDKTNREIIRLIDEAISERDQIDVFFLDQLRALIRNSFVSKKLIDDFKLYKVSDCNIHLTYKYRMAVQQFDLHIDAKSKCWKTFDTEYFENPFEEIQL